VVIVNSSALDILRNEGEEVKNNMKAFSKAYPCLPAIVKKNMVAF
jgi:hypothetical protein